MKKKTKKIILMLGVILGVMSLLGISVMAETYEGFDYYVEEEQVTITYYNRQLFGAISIPAEIDGFPVTRIGYNAFSGCYGLTEIIIPDSVEYIDDQAFYECHGLTEIIIPDSVEHIGAQAFRECYRLTEIIVPDSVEYIGEGAFSDCIGLTSISVPFVGESRDAKSSRNAVFGHIFGYNGDRDGALVGQYYNSYGNRESFTLPHNLRTVKITDATQIPYGAFSGCSILENISINSGVTLFGDKAFANCDSLLDLEIKARNARLPKDGNLFDKCNLMALHIYEGSTLHAYAWNQGIDFELIDDGTLTSLDGESILRGNDIIVALSFEKKVSSGEVICSFFDNNDRLVKTVFVPVIRTTDTIYVTAPDTAEIAYAKVMTRESIDSLEPETLATVVEISR